MLRFFSVIIALAVIFSGCTAGYVSLDKGMALREDLKNGCEFTAHIVADFAENSYSFSMKCSVDPSGELRFEVISPDSISGICGTVSSAGGKLTFDGSVLAFPLLADGEISPVSAPWLCMRAISKGYLRSVGDEDDRTRLTIDDSFSGENLMVDVWVAKNGVPEYSELLWNNRKILSVRFDNFAVL